MLYALTVPPAGQGQTLYADCAAAWERLGEQQREEIRGLVGIHSPTLIGRSADAVRAGEAPASLLPHQRPQQQPLVRVHPVTGRESLYLCEPEQLDFVDGPIVGMETGPDGAGARLIDDLLAHVTRAKFVYAHTWQPGDLVIGDNRCLLHCASWYDANHYARMMWRTTVYGNPGEHYAGELPSWIPEDGTTPMAGLEHAKHC